MNAISKSRLQMLFLSNGLRIRNAQRGSEELRLVDWRPKGSFDKTGLNILRAEDVSQVEARPSTKRDADTSTERNDKAGTEKDDKVDMRRRDNAVSTRRQDNNKVGNPRQDNKMDIEG